MKKFNLMLAYILAMAIAVPTASILVVRKHKKSIEAKKVVTDSTRIK